MKTHNREVAERRLTPRPLQPLPQASGRPTRPKSPPPPPRPCLHPLWPPVPLPDPLEAGSAICFSWRPRLEVPWGEGRVPGPTLPPAVALEALSQLPLSPSLGRGPLGPVGRRPAAGSWRLGLAGGRASMSPDPEPQPASPAPAPGFTRTQPSSGPAHRPAQKGTCWGGLCRSRAVALLPP